MRSAFVGPYIATSGFFKAADLGAKVDSLDDVEFPMPNLSKETASVQAKLREAGWQGGSYVVIVPGARWWTKEWPVEHYIELAKKITAGGTAVVLAGGPDDAVKGGKIAEGAASPLVLDMTGRTSLRELAALIKACSFYISADTGPLHFAAYQYFFTI